MTRPLSARAWFATQSFHGNLGRYIDENRVVPGFKLLRVVPGDPNVRPHDCLENLNLENKCSMCGAEYREEQP